MKQVAVVPQPQAVDFARELDVLERFLATGRFRLAVIGGVALTAYGHPRMTLDLDLVTEASAQETLVAFLESQGFVTLHRSSGYSNHRHADRNRGRVDFMYVRGNTADQLFASAKELPGPAGEDLSAAAQSHRRARIHGNLPADVRVHARSHTYTVRTDRGRSNDVARRGCRQFSAPCAGKRDIAGHWAYERPSGVDPCWRRAKTIVGTARPDPRTRDYF